MLRLALFSLLVSLASASVLAQEADPIREQVTKIAREHDAIAVGTNALVTSELEARVKATAATGNLDAVKKLVAEKKAYETSGAMPAWLSAIPAVKNAVKALADADAKLDAAYQNAEITYTKALKLDQAEAIRAERLEAKLSHVTITPDAPVVSKPEVATPPKAVTAERNPAMGTIDLMPMIDVERDSANGRWSRVQDGFRTNLVSDRGWGSGIRIRYEPPEEYDFIMEFTRNDGNDGISQLCWGYGHRFRWVMGGWNNTACAIDEVRTQNYGENPTSVKMKLESGKRYKSVVKVRKGQISCYLDDKLITSLETDYSNLSYNAWGYDPGILGITTSNSSYTIHKVAITEVTGKGKRPPRPVSPNPFNRTRRFKF